MHKTQTIKEKIVERYSSLVDNSEQFTNTLKKPLKQTFRINSIKGNKDEILNQGYRQNDSKDGHCAQEEF